MTKSGWTKADMPSQKGKLVIVTGSTGGLGYETALGLAEAGASVIVAARNDAKGKDALERIKAIVPNADVVFEKVDFASLLSVKEFCERFHSQHQVLDILVNNAGLMGRPQREMTDDGFELHFETNYLTHFALTAQLLPALKKSKHARVVHVSSYLHHRGKLNFDDLQFNSNYSYMAAYSQSKLANLLFMTELQRRSDAGGWGLMSNAAHPGFSRTEIINNGPGNDEWFMKLSNWFIAPIFSQSAADGALTNLYAATAPEAKAGGFYGPNGFMETNGPPVPVSVLNEVNNLETAKKLWDISVKLTGVTWPQ